MKILIKGANVLQPDYSTGVADIAIADDVIAAVGEVPGDFVADYIIEGKDHFAVPGLVNAHTHASMTLLRSYADDMELMDWLNNRIWPVEAKMVENDIRVGAKLALVEMVKGGTTAYADMYGPCMESVAEETISAGVRVILSRCLIGFAPTAMKSLAENVDLYKNYHGAGDGLISILLGVHAPYTCPPDFCKAAAKVSAEHGINVHIHMSETQDEIRQIQEQYGKGPFQYIAETGLFDRPSIAAHCVWLDDADIAMMKEKAITPVHNPGSNMKLASGVAPVPKLLAAGVHVALGTDGASSNNNLDMLEEIRLAAMLHKVHELNPLAVPAAEALRMGTEYGAEALWLEKTGRLQAGWKADIVLYDMNRPEWCPRHDLVSLLVYSANSSSADTVLCNGKVLMEKGELKTLDEEKILHEANACAMDLVNRG